MFRKLISVSKKRLNTRNHGSLDFDAVFVVAATMNFFCKAWLQRLPLSDCDQTRPPQPPAGTTINH